MKKYYEVGWHKCSIEKTSSGYYKVNITDIDNEMETEELFSTKEKALEEILSYAEVFGVDEFFAGYLKEGA